MSKESVSGVFLVILTLFLTLATFMQVLDTTIANVSIPTIAGDLGVTPSKGTWIITSFAVSNAITMPLTGWLSRRFGEVKLFALSTFLFSLASLLCGLSSSFEMLIFSRVLQGAVAAPMMPLSQSLLLANYPPHKKGLALAFWAMTATIGPIVGPLLGGYITDNFHWGWVFYINVPIGVLCSFMVWELLKDKETEISKQPIDYIGLILLIVGVSALQIMLDNGNELDWFNSAKIVTLAVVSFVSFSFFIVWEIFNEHPVIDVTLFKYRNFTIGAIAISLGYSIFLGGGVVFPLWLQIQLGYTAFWAGFAASSVGIFAFLLSPIIGANMHRWNLRILVSISFLIFAISYFWMSKFNTNIDLITATLPRLLMGAGMSMFFVPLTAIILSQIKASHTASAMGLVNFLRILGGGLGTSVAVSLWDNWGSEQHAILAEHINKFSHNTQEILDKFGANTKAILAYLNHITTNQAMTISNDEILFYSAVACVILIILVWFTKPPFMVKKAV